MKKSIYSLLLLFICFQCYSQNKKDELDMDDFKHLFETLKSDKIDVKKELQWSYSYLDVSKEKLVSLANALKADSLKANDIVVYNRDNRKQKLVVYEVKTYTQKEYYDRVVYINSVAKANGLENYQAIIGANKPSEQSSGTIESYKKVGIGKNRK